MASAWHVLCTVGPVRRTLAGASYQGFPRVLQLFSEKCVVGHNVMFIIENNVVLKGRAAQAIVYTHPAPRLPGPAPWPVAAAAPPTSRFGLH